jgi:proton-dependent oligopeptide transporter, POT family
LTTLTATTPPAATNAAHPRGLYVLFGTEAWERFSYYGMRALLVLYLVNALHVPRIQALQMYGIYTGLVYLTPIFGGWIADKYLGARLTAVVGGTVMMLGHFAMAFPALLHVALGLLIIGNGFFKPNTTSMVGELYEGPQDPRRDGGYTIFYMGINLGSFISSFICGTLGQNVGWHWGFASAGVGMFIGLCTLIGLQDVLGGSGLKPGQRPIGLHNVPVVAAFTAASIAVVYGVLAVFPLIESALAGVPSLVSIVGGVAVIWAALTLWSKATTRPGEAPAPLTRAERLRVAAVCILVIFVIFFWMGFEQAGGSMSLFADKQTDRHVGGFEIPSTWFQSINPLLIVLLAPFFSMLWTRVNKSSFPLSDVAKQGLGMIVLGLGFVVMFFAQSRANVQGTVGPQWLFFVYALHTIGELMLSPVGLSMVSRAAPHRVAALLMGVWFIANGVANYFAGALEGLLAGSGIPPYLFLLGSSIGMGVLLLILTPLLNRMLDSRDAVEAPDAPLKPALS